ncbi:AAA family ATPase [uncultured Paracoccus sp.]|uniref:AAA family ATPase n=1 Tax=uncultured Paracoccus sp. TaxID=189685 RepID=UPI0026333109|nr:AAA family ATPase [uncultured Paracoccus sp.]
MLDRPQKLRAIICGSAGDAESLRASGYRSIKVISSPEQTLGSDGELDPSLAMFTEFVLVYSEAAADLRDQIAVRLGDVRCRWAELPEQSPSVRQTHADYGTDAIVTAVNTARPMWTDEISRLSDIPEAPDAQTYETGIRGLDEIGIRMVRPMFWPIIGPYGSGKSILARQLAANFWKLHGWRTLVTVFEEKVKPRMRRDFRRHFCDHAHSIMTDEDEARADLEIEKALMFLRRPRRERLDAGRLFDRIEYACRVYGLDVVMIDPVNEIDHQVGRGESKTDYMGRFMMDLKALADDYGLIVMLLAHPPKDGTASRNSKGKIYTLNDGADTAHYGNKADMGWTVWRPFRDLGTGATAPTYLNIDKTKDHEIMGKPTLATLHLKGCSFVVGKTGFEAYAEIAGDSE